MQSSSVRRQSALPPIAAVILALLLPLTLPFAAAAQSDDDIDSAAAGGAVARIDAISGDVAIQRGDSDDTVAAVPNAPVLGADYVTTGDNGRAEVGFDGRSAVRLGENVQIRFSKLEATDRQMQLAAGTVDLRLFGDTDGQSAIDTPSISIVPRSAGSFRVSVDNDGVTAVTVREGRADIITPQGTQSLSPGTTLVADGPASNPQINTQRAIANDNFDSYNAERDHIYELATTASPYVNQDIQGIGDLNANGSWVDDGTYGHVWIPSHVAADWAPYRDGSWAWEDRYGWTWVAHESWGWAPYHYGRWYFSENRHRWAWYPPAPGRFAPAWSPALVGFVGFNIGAVSVGIGFGNIGWVPLAPYESFHPWWGGRGTTVARNTIINNTTINIHYRNMGVNRAVTSVTRENFQSGRFNERVAVSQEQIRTYRPVAMQGALPIVPGRANLRFSQREVSPSLASRPAFAQQRFAGRTAVTQRTPFNEQQQNVSRVTHVAYRPESGNAPDRRPSFGSERQTAPAFSRGANAPSYSRGASNERGFASNERGFASSERGATNAQRGATNESWSRFNSNRGGDYRGAQNVTPGYARPATQGSTFSRSAATQDEGRRMTPSYTRPASANESRPSFSNDARTQGDTRSPGYMRSQGDTRSQNETRSAAPVYQRQSQYQRQEAPAYQRQTAPVYNDRATAPNSAFNRFSTQPQPQAQQQQRFDRAQAPSYQRQSAPQYQRAERSAPAGAPERAQPQARASHDGGERHAEGRRETR